MEEKMISCFEHLPNELIYKIFRYFDYLNIHTAFSNLNRRFSKLINNDSNFPIAIHLSSMSKQVLKRYNETIIEPNKHRIRSIYISNEFMHEIIFPTHEKLPEFTQIEALNVTIEGKYLEKFLEQLHSLPLLSSLVTRIQPTIITPTFYLHSPYVEILDFILYKHPTSTDEYSIYFSGRRHSWTWSDIYCFFTNSNESVHGSIDRRSEEPFVLCPLPSFAQKLLFNGNSQLNLSLRIHDKSFPNTSLLLSNITVPIYHRNRYNVSIYTMICNRTEVLVEWIEYHLLIGVEHFYLYDHFSTDNLNYFLRSYLERQLVTIIRWPYRPLKGHYWNMMQSASMNHALKTFGSFNRWMGYFDVDEYFQITDPTKLLNHTISLSDFLDQNFPESTYPGGVQFRNCPISCLFDEVGIASSRYRLLFEKCRHIHSEQDCQSRTKMFIRPRHVPIMQNIHALEHGIQFASSSQSSSLAQFRHYHYGVMLITMSENDTIDRSMDIFIDELKKRIISYL